MVAVVALVPVVASAAMVVPSIATASSTEGTDISGVAAALAGQVDADPTMTADIAGSDSSDVAAKGSNGSTESCPPAPAGAQAVAPAEPCAAAEPPPADAAGAASAAVASPNAGTVAAPVSLGGGLVFDAGNIVSDAVFYNGAAMTDEQIASFIAEQGAGCAGEWCLKNLRVDVAAQPADEFCAAIPGGVGLSAAAVIGAVSRACGVNPQVMVVTLEKESGLLDRSSVSAASYDAAWGWHCPDTGPGGSANCDPAYAGFVNQAYGMAKQWTRYRVHPEQYRYRAGETVDILWNVVESGCGGAPVTIANTATAALYNYTPYQPNAAALAAYPGVGDACSAYGNRNFFFLFNRYFGSTGGGSTGIVVGPGGVATAAVTTPVEVPVPANGFVAGGLAGRSIMAPSAAVAAGLRAGFAALGLPYVWGGGGSGAGPNNGCARGGGQYNSCGTEVGFDCSGLTAYVLGQAGFTIPGDSSSQRRSGIPVSWDRALPGDIVGYPGHVAMYLGVTDGIRYILEASWVGTPVHIVPLTRSDADPTVYRYWSSSPGSVVAAGLGATVPRTFVPNLPPLPVPAAGARTVSPAQPVMPTVAAQSASQGPLSSGPAANPSSGSPAPSASSSTSSSQSSGPAPQTSGSTATGTTSTTTTGTSATTVTGTTVTGTTRGTGTTAPTDSTVVTPQSTTATGTSRPATSAPTTATSTGQSATTSSLPTTSTSTATSAATTAAATTSASTATSPAPTTPVICPAATPTAVPTPTLPPPSVSSPASTAGAANPVPATTSSSTFAALLESLTADPCG